MLAWIFDFVVRRIFSIVAELLGVAAIILPSTVREHFFSSAQRIVSFIFLMLFVNGAAKFLLSALMSFIDLFGLSEKLKLDIINSTQYKSGYYEGYDDGKNNRHTKIKLINEKTSIWLRLLKALKYVLVFVLFAAVIMTSNW
ncbi:MAG: hypothetical protein IJR35_07900 [Synergistaceae bacterium]|nr:hypothetical protein [Synergistaceae bacterium]MBQ9404536.1 hypothetical protein [Synergistaceae bacterium]MBQ9595764.1 hypothetical protein [Synergistaceae bacterium]